ncbi:motile sperm domain-containing protein 2 isoform X4 [Pitangus sulphuratus]|nr:motile sperm domain-containing protein 2 isoform X4 [Pitangus sulphuratus]
MAEQRQDKAALISETRRRFEAEYLPDKSDKYDSRDVERLQQDDKWVENYLIWRHDVVDDTLKMIDESFQWRKEYTVNDLSESVLPKWLFEIGALFLHGYDKEGYKLFWFKVKHHTRDPKQQLDKKKLVAFWLEHYAKRDHGKPLTVVFDMAETGISHIVLKLSLTTILQQFNEVKSTVLHFDVCSMYKIRDLDFVRFIVNCFTDYYPNFLTKIVIFEMPWIMNAAFKIVKGWLGPDAISMLKFTNKSDIQEYISGEYLPPHMGGTDSFKYSYPPLVDDDFQTPLCENGPITNEDEHESKEELDADTKETGELSEAQNLNQKKMNSIEHISKSEETDKTEVKPKNAKKALTTFKGPLLHIRLRCHVIESSKPSSLTLKDNAFNVPAKTNEDLHIQLTRLLQINKRLDEQMNRCLWFQQLSVVLSLLSVTVSAFCFYLAYAQRS